MVAPLPPSKIEDALRRGSQDELDEFHRLVEASLLVQMDPLKILKAEDEVRLKELGRKLFGT